MACCGKNIAKSAALSDPKTPSAKGYKWRVVDSDNNLTEWATDVKAWQHRGLVGGSVRAVPMAEGDTIDDDGRIVQDVA